MADVLEIARGISQAIANSHDGALDEDGEPVKIGLRREEDVPITDRRVMDGFKIALHGDQLMVKYHSEIPLKEVHGKDFEGEISDMLEKIASFLKKEYKKVTKSALTLSRNGEADVMVQSLNRHRSWVQATQVYDIGNYGEAVERSSNDEGNFHRTSASSEDRLDKAMKDWISQGRESAKKPTNVTRKGDQ